jgi:acyl-CoA thioesterase
MRLIPDVQKIDHPGFHTDMHLVSNGSLEHAVTFHHLKQWDDFLFYDLIYREKIENR